MVDITKNHLLLQRREQSKLMNICLVPGAIFSANRFCSCTQAVPAPTEATLLLHRRLCFERSCPLQMFGSQVEPAIHDERR
jgi:hypothetical protein